MMINVNASVECIVRVRKIILGVLAYVFVRAVSIVDNSEIFCSKTVFAVKLWMLKIIINKGDKYCASKCYKYSADKL